MNISFDVNKKQIENDLRTAEIAAVGIVAFFCLKGLNNVIREYKQNREIKKLKKRVTALEEKVG